LTIRSFGTSENIADEYRFFPGDAASPVNRYGSKKQFVVDFITGPARMTNGILSRYMFGKNYNTVDNGPII